MTARRQSRYVLPLLALVAAPLCLAGEPVAVVGSATFSPLAQQVARRASLSPDGGDYRIEANGTIAGIQAFCAGDGPGYPDILHASRRMRDAEVDTCTAHGVTAIAWRSCAARYGKTAPGMSCLGAPATLPRPCGQTRMPWG